MTRRYFLMSSAAATGHALSAAALGSPSDTVRVACVGVRGRGKDHIKAYVNLPNVELAALCDVDESVLDARLKEIESTGKNRPKAYTGFRQLLEDRSIDAVSIATPNTPTYTKVSGG